MSKEKKCPLKPRGDRVVAVKVDVSEITEAGIAIPSQARKGQVVARVVAVGPGRLLGSGERSKMDSEVGDLIVIGKVIDTEFLFRGINYLLLRDPDVIANLGEEVQESVPEEGE